MIILKCETTGQRVEHIVNLNSNMIILKFQEQ